MEHLSLLLFILLCLVAEGFFSGSEIALVSLNRARLKHLADKSKTARLIERGLERPELLLGTTLVGTNLAVVTGNALATLFVVSTFGEKYQPFVIAVMWPLLLLFGEFVPKSIFQQKSDKLAFIIIYPLYFFAVFLAPVIWFISLFPKIFLKMCGLDSGKARRIFTREDLSAMIEPSSAAGPIAKMEGTMIQRVLSFGEKTVREAMMPLVDVVAIAKRSTWDDVKKILSEHPFTRYPVYEKRIDNIVGILHSFDLLGLEISEDWRKVVRQAYYAAENAPLDRTLLEMQSNGHTMAVVVDEYGGAVGILTMEDIVEEVVGEIEDEYEKHKALYRKIDNSTWLMSGRLEIEKMEEILNIKIPRRDYETLAGFLLSNMEKIPKTGEIFRFNGLLFQVVKATDRVLEEVLVRREKEK